MMPGVKSRGVMDHGTRGPGGVQTGKAVVAGLLAIFVGIGLSRFAYSPLLPAVIEAGWFSPSDAAYLGAANLAGYLVGALSGRRLSAWSSPTAVLRVSMLLASLAFVGSAFPLSFSWFFVWRLVSGITGGALMVVAAPTVLAHVEAGRRGRAAGIIFAGVGLGIVLSGTLVPALLGAGLQTTWLALAALSFAATGLSWTWWPDSRMSRATVVDTRSPVAGKLGHPGVVAIYLSYGLIAIGLVPHMIFLVDFVARGLAAGLAAGGVYWVIFGIGALLGPLVAGALADRFGFDRAVRAVLVPTFASVAIVALNQSLWVLVATSLLVGAAVSGTVPLVLGQIQKRVHTPDGQKTAWGVATATFALGQAGGAYAYSFLFAKTDGDFELLFAIGATVLAAALMTNLLAGASPAKPDIALSGSAPDKGAS